MCVKTSRKSQVCSLLHRAIQKKIYIYIERRKWPKKKWNAIKRQHFLALLFMPFLMVWFILLQLLASKTTNRRFSLAVVEFWPFGTWFLVREQTLPIKPNTTQVRARKGMKNCVKNGVIFVFHFVWGHPCLASRWLIWIWYFHLSIQSETLQYIEDTIVQKLTWKQCGIFYF